MEVQILLGALFLVNKGRFIHSIHYFMVTFDEKEFEEFDNVGVDKLDDADDTDEDKDEEDEEEDSD